MNSDLFKDKFYDGFWEGSGDLDKYSKLFWLINLLLNGLLEVICYFENTSSSGSSISSSSSFLDWNF